MMRIKNKRLFFDNGDSINLNYNISIEKDHTSNNDNTIYRLLFRQLDGYSSYDYVLRFNVEQDRDIFLSKINDLLSK